MRRLKIPLGPVVLDPAGPALTDDDRGRLLLGDIIVAIEGEPVRSSSDLLLLLEQRDAGDSVRVTIVSKGKEHDVRAVLQAPKIEAR